jgi:nickel/cobalt exporter
MKIQRLIWGLLVVLCLNCTMGLAYGANQNPFFTKKAPKQVFTIKPPAAVRVIIQKLFIVQQKFNSRLAGLTREVKENHRSKSVWLLMGVAFVYGMVHAVGPGHGKTLIFSYCLASPAQQLKIGLLYGLLIAVLQSVSATLIVATLNFIIRHSFTATFENVNQFISRCSNIMIVLIGLWLLIAKIRTFASGQALRGPEKTTIDKSLWSLIISIGIIPCPAVTLILLFALSLNMMFIGLLLVGWLTVGVATTITGVGLIIILARRNLTQLVGEKQRLLGRINDIMGFSGALLITFCGLVLLVSSGW